MMTGTGRRASSRRRPLVSVGLPVYNGANYIQAAMEAVLAQSYDHLELIISDNASTDDTPVICARIAAHDARVRVSRNDTNIGAAANYNRVFELARGKYFKWAAHDDLLAATFIERAVDVLESRPDVVMCSSRTRRINEANEITGSYPGDTMWEARSAAARFRSLVFTHHACVAVFGLGRRDVMRCTPLIGGYVNSDRVLLAELGLRGRIHEIPDDLFFRRDHAGSSLRAFPDPRERIAWFDPAKSAHLAFPEWNLILGYVSAVLRTPLGPRDRAQCLGTIANWSLRQWRPLLADFKYAALGLGPGRSA